MTMRYLNKPSKARIYKQQVVLLASYAENGVNIVECCKKIHLAVMPQSTFLCLPKKRYPKSESKPGRLPNWKDNVLLLPRMLGPGNIARFFLSNQRIHFLTLVFWRFFSSPSFRHSRYPVGHFIRCLGPIGDKATENQVLLLEHDIPHSSFGEAVLDCLPTLPWSITPKDEKERVDLRHIAICSVDPPGCTDIDDALHCFALPNGNFQVHIFFNSPFLVFCYSKIAFWRFFYECFVAWFLVYFQVGVHIADVSHFIRPGTAIDKEAANRSTTVYLTDRRIDMVI